MAKKSNESPDDTHLPGMQPEKNTKIHRAAGVLKTRKAEATEAREKMKDAEKRLIEVLLENGWKPGQVYRHGDIKIQLKSSMSVNVKIVDESAEEADDDDEDEGKGIVSDKNATDSLDEDPRPAKLKNAEKAREAKGEEVPG